MFSPSVPQTTGYWRFSVNNNMTWLVRKGTLSTPSVTYNYRPPDFSWQHIALSWSGHFGNSNLRIYHNGQLVSDATKVGGGGNRVSDANNMFTLGNRPQGNSSYFKGWMDDFRIWERVITPTEVEDMYTCLTGNQCHRFRYGCLQRLRPRSGHRLGV